MKYKFIILYAYIMVLTVTILIQMHGKIFTSALNSRTADLFNNVRLLCKAEGFIDLNSTVKDELILHGSIVDKFRHNIDLSTYDKLKTSNSGDLLGNVTYDKTLSRTIGDLGFVESLDPRILITTPFQGIYLISVHENRRLIYPNNADYDNWINLLKLEDINKVANWFHRQVPNIADLSTPFPNQMLYLEEARLNPQSVNQIKQQYLNALNAWNLTMDSDSRIDIIKLSFLIELVKTIIADDCVINLLDYSCNSPIINILDKNGYKYYKDNIINKKQDAYSDELDFMERGIALNTSLGGRIIKKTCFRNKQRKRKTKTRTGTHIKQRRTRRKK